MSLHETTSPLRRGLVALRRRVRAILLVAGVGRVAVFVLAALVAFFFADYLLRLPLWVRTVTLVLLIAGTAFVTVRRLLAPLARRLSDTILAGRVERAFPELEDRLVSSLAFARAEKKPDPDSEDSPELMRAVCDEAVRIAQPGRFPHLARSTPAARWAGAAAALLVVVVLASTAQAELVRTFARRSLLLQDVSWPRRTTLDVVGMVPGQPRLVTRGRETTVEVRAEGSVPDRVRFVYWEADADRSRAEEVELTPSSEDPALFAITMPVYESVRFVVSGGDDDRERVYGIDALTPPTILAIEMECSYPEYLGRPKEVLRGGDQRVPQGTSIRLRVRANMQLRQALLATGGAQPTPLARDENGGYAATLKPEKDLRYSIRLVGLSGEENDPGADSYVVRVARDQPPTVRVATPGPRPERLPGGLVLIGFSARDDYGVERIVLRYRVGSDEAGKTSDPEKSDKPDGPGKPDESEAFREAVFGEADGNGIRSQRGSVQGADHVVGLFVLDLAALKTAKGATLTKEDPVLFKLVVRDSKGQTRETRADYRVSLIDETDLAGGLDVRKGELQSTLGRTLEKAQDIRLRLDGIDGASDDEREFRRLCNSAQAAQARIIEDLEAAARRVQAILDTYVFNRLGDRSSADQMLPFYERHLLSRDESARAFGGDLYGNIWAAYREKAIRVGDAHVKLVEMANLADRLASVHGPNAYRALGALGTLGRTTNESAYETAKTRVADEQQTIVDGLKRLRRLSREWENYESVIRFFKSLRSRQERLVEELAPKDER